MRKLLTLFLGLFITVAFVSSQEYWNRYFIDEDFEGATMMPSAFTERSGGSGGSSAVFGRNAGVEVKDGHVVYTGGSGGGNRGAELAFTPITDKPTVFVEFDWDSEGAQVGPKNATAVYLLGSNPVLADDETANDDAILVIYAVGTSGKLHVWNKDISPETPRVFGQGGGLLRMTQREEGTEIINLTDSINEASITNVDFAVGSAYHILAEIDFTTKKIVSLTITDLENPVNTETISDLPFIDDAATDIARIGINQSRSTPHGNGNTVQTMALTLDNIQVYEKVLSLGRADVTILYQDLDGGEAKAQRVVPQQEVGLEYYLLASDKETFVANGNYYAFDQSASTDSVEVELNTGATLIAKFKKTAATTGTYTWTGEGEFWNQLDDNFTTDNTNRLAYQNTNAVAFSKADAPIKEVNLNDDLDLGEADVTISAADYVIKGAGSIKGTGKVVVNESADIGFKNHLEGGVELNAGTLRVSHAEAANLFTVKDGVTLDMAPNVSYNKPITGSGGALTIIPSSQVDYSSDISGVDEVNYILQVKGNQSGYSYSQMPRMNNNVNGATINVTTVVGDTTYFGTTIDHTNSKIVLGDHVYYVHNENPPNSGDVTAHRHIGALSSTSETSGVFGAALRVTHYYIGGLNTDEVFAGTFNEKGDNPKLFISKVGKGSWTLTGNSTDFAGNFYVVDGKLIVDGSLFAPTFEGVDERVFNVADTATVAGIGSINIPSAVIDGTIEGSLNFSNSVDLGPTSKTVIRINGETSDKITAGGDFYYGGTLQVIVDALPGNPVDFKIIDAPNYYEADGEGGDLYGFNSVVLPSENWSFDFFSGVLTYKGGDTGVKGIDFSKEIESINYFDLTGKKVKENHHGFVIVKVKYTDGTSGVFKTFNKYENK